MKPNPQLFPFPLLSLEETDSTNNYLTQLCEGLDDIAEFTTISAEYQTAGKGQRGNSWEGAAGANLLFSFVTYPRFVEARQQFLLSQITSLSIKDALDCHITDISIKWPNDIYWKDKKICGILIENVLDGHSIARCISGVGLNVNQTEFLSDAPNPVSLKQITGKDIDRHALLADILRFSKRYYDDLKLRGEDCADELAQKYSESLYRREGIHPFKDKNGTFEASILQVEPEGRLILLDTDGHKRGYLFKEVQFII